MVEYINSQRAEYDAELRHDNFMAKVPKVLGDAAPKFLGTAIYTNGTGAKIKRQVYNFPKREACLMMMSYDYDLQAKVYDRMTELEHELATKTHERQSARLEAPAMTAAIQGTRTEVGKETLPHHYSNEYDMINRIVLGCTSGAYRKKNELEKDDAIRDAMTALQITAVTELQRVNTSLIEVGTEYEERKTKLTALFMRKHAAKLTEEIMRLEA